MTTPYVAPARYAVTTLHRRDPEGAPDPAAADPVEGLTRCGKPMLASELWVPVEDTRGAELLCTGCMLPGNAAAAEVTEDVLF